MLVVGIPCSGKSTLARALAAARGVPHIEVDLYHYGPDWVVPADFPAQIEALTQNDAWVADDWGVPQVRDLLWSRAEHLIWLDPPRWLAEYRAVRRTLLRIITRERVAGDNRETITSWLGKDHPVRFVWSRHATARSDMEQRLRDPRWEGLVVSRLRTRSEVRAFAARAARPASREA